MRLNKKVESIIGIIIATVLMIGIIIGIFYLGIDAFSNLLGFKYDSIWALAIFVISFIVLGLFIDAVFDAITVLAVEKVNAYIIAFVIQLFFLFISELIALVVVDAVMISVTLSVKTLVIISFTLALLGTLFDNKKT